VGKSEDTFCKVELNCLHERKEKESRNLKHGRGRGIKGRERTLRQEYWRGLPFPTSRDLPHPGIEPASLASSVLAGKFSTNVPPGKPLYMQYFNLINCVIYIHLLVYIFSEHLFHTLLFAGHTSRHQK